jgi:hypothetical protein
VIRWRDIPAQVNGRRGDERHQIVLPRRFQRSIDEAAMRAGKRTANEYIAEWRRETIAVAPEADLGAAVARLAAEIDAALSREALGAFVRTGGFDPTTHPEIPAPADAPDDDPDDDVAAVAERDA